MPLYTYYPCKPDGTSESFVSIELEGDEEARRRALAILDQHRSASHVAVWCGERKVLDSNQLHSDPSTVLARDPVSREPGS